MKEDVRHWDVFVSHASEDKDTFVRPLATSLQALGLSVWYDEFSLQVGDSLSRSIDRGLAVSRYGVVVISPHFIRKRWPEYELRGLVAREIDEDRVILPIWHGVVHRMVLAFSPPLADKFAIETAGREAEDIAIELLRVIRPDLYQVHPRSELKRLATGEALRDLQNEVERGREELDAAKEQLAEFQCPYCGSAIITRIDRPVDPEHKVWDTQEVFAGEVYQPCPSDPRFPKFEDYELRFREHHDDGYRMWQCSAVPRTAMARHISLPSGSGNSREEAEARVREAYQRYRRP